MATVRIKNLVKKYGAVTAVDGIDLDIGAGEFVVLLGPSGCGKTTTLRCVAGLEDISGGEIAIDDHVVSSATEMVAPERREIGMVFQSYAIWPHLSVADNVAFGLKLKKVPAREIAERVGDVLALVGLADYRNRSASQLSGGQQQRVALARAVVHEPRVLLFDEPLSNLDAKLRERMRFELNALQKRLGITSIYVTHDQQEALVVADRIVLMNGGHIAQVGRPQDIYEHPSSHFAADFIGLANIVTAKVVAVDETASMARARTDDGTEFVVRADTLRVGQPIRLVFRPENLEISEQPLTGGDNAFEVTLTANYYLGNISDVFVRISGIELRGQLSPPRPWRLGGKLWARIAPNAIVILPGAEDASEGAGSPAAEAPATVAPRARSSALGRLA